MLNLTPIENTSLHFFQLLDAVLFSKLAHADGMQFGAWVVLQEFVDGALKVYPSRDNQCAIAGGIVVEYVTKLYFGVAIFEWLMLGPFPDDLTKLFEVKFPQENKQHFVALFSFPRECGGSKTWVPNKLPNIRAILRVIAIPSITETPSKPVGSLPFDFPD